MGLLFWEELLGKYGRCVRGAALISTDGQVLKSTLTQLDDLEFTTRQIATLIASLNCQIDIKTATGWILAAPLNKQQILVVVIDSDPYTCFNLDLVSLFAEDSASDDDSRLVDPTILPLPPKRDGARAVPKYED
jgi:predicted regulator of Ras-like GTPase activity (Roadblock/LC7/MglB family)